MQKNYIGEKYNRLTVLDEIDGFYGKHKVKFFVCRCDCGKVVRERKSDVLRSVIKSCGCYKRDITIERSTKHGASQGGKQTRLYRVWANMKRRCYDKKQKFFKDYGGRGIRVCDEWRKSFSTFRDWALSNGYSDDLTIDRIDVNGNYEPSNCRWVTRKEQANNRRNTVYVTIDGITKTLTEWAEFAGLNKSTLKNRYCDGVRGVMLLHKSENTKFKKGYNKYDNPRHYKDYKPPTIIETEVNE